MKVLSLDRKKKLARLAVENSDDLWHLYNLIDPEDTLLARTSREIKAEGEAARPGAGRRMMLNLGVQVVDAFFDKNSNRLRVRGKITQCPERFEGLHGAHHSHSISVGTVLTLAKDNWSPTHLRRLQDASNVKSPPVLIAALDDEEICVAQLGRFGFEVKFDKRVKIPGKLEADKRKDAFKIYFDEIASALAHVAANKQIVIVGPGFVKTDFMSYMKNTSPALASKVVHVGHGSFGGEAGVSEALRSGALTKVLRQNRVIMEMNLIEDLLFELAKSNKASYGVDNIEQASNYGAVETLLVVDRYLREVSDEERKRVEGIMHAVEKTRGKVMIISGEHEGGEKIRSLGGLAAKLRFVIS